MKNSEDSLNYSVEWAKQAATYFLKMDCPTQKRIDLHVQWLAENPKSLTLDIKPIIGIAGLLRLRVGKYRIIFSIEEEIKIIHISRLLPRGEVYKYL